MKSILQSEKGCYVTGSLVGLYQHHVYGGARHKTSGRRGCWVWLRGDWHSLAPYGVHSDPNFDAALERADEAKARCMG